MSKVYKFLLTATAFAPALLIYALLNLAERQRVAALVFAAVGVLLSVLCVALLSYACRNGQPRDFRTESVEEADTESVGFLLVYLLPLIFREHSDWNMAVWLAITLLFCAAVAFSYGHQYNPLLCCFGFHLYRVKASGGIPHVLITRRRLHKSCETFRVARLTDYVLIEKPIST